MLSASFLVAVVAALAAAASLTRRQFFLPSMSGWGDPVSIRVGLSVPDLMSRGGFLAVSAWRRFFGRAVASAVIVAALGAAHAAAARHVAAASGPLFEWILLDAETGQVLGEHDADELTYPASLTKMMTLYLTFEALNQGRIRLDQQFPVSAEAAYKAPSKLGLSPG